MAKGCDFEDNGCRCYENENDRDIRVFFDQVSVEVYKKWAELRPGSEFDGKVKEIIEERENVYGRLTCMEIKSYMYLIENGGTESWKDEFEREEERMNLVLRTLIQCSDVGEMRREIIGKLICFCLVF